MEDNGFEFYIRESNNGIYTIGDVVATPWLFTVIAERDLFEGDLTITIRGYGNTEEDARRDAKSKIFIYNSIFSGLQ
jgi:hypothetical protein